MGREADSWLHSKRPKPGHGQHLGSHRRVAGCWFSPLCPFCPVPVFVPLAAPQAHGFEPAWPLTALLQVFLGVLLSLFYPGISTRQGSSPPFLSSGLFLAANFYNVFTDGGCRGRCSSGCGEGGSLSPCLGRTDTAGKHIPSF